mmetsp:Transcript_16945/g.48976  ORF Transcript_16945/g.48976 Transcript_16945/m.48976 type:complete len:350 (-) Transcript_16945:639-1688(-)
MHIVLVFVLVAFFFFFFFLSSPAVIMLCSLIPTIILLLLRPPEEVAPHLPVAKVRGTPPPRTRREGSEHLPLRRLDGKDGVRIGPNSTQERGEGRLVTAAEGVLHPQMMARDAVGEMSLESLHEGRGQDARRPARSSEAGRRRRETEPRRRGKGQFSVASPACSAAQYAPFFFFVFLVSMLADSVKSVEVAAVRGGEYVIQPDGGDIIIARQLEEDQSFARPDFETFLLDFGIGRAVPLAHQHQLRREDVLDDAATLAADPLAAEAPARQRWSSLRRSCSGRAIIVGLACLSLSLLDILFVVKAVPVVPIFFVVMIYDEAAAAVPNAVGTSRARCLGTYPRAIGGVSLE